MAGRGLRAWRRTIWWRGPAATASVCKTPTANGTTQVRVLPPPRIIRHPSPPAGTPCRMPDAPTEHGAAWQRTSFGTRGSRVRIPLFRPCREPWADPVPGMRAILVHDDGAWTPPQRLAHSIMAVPVTLVHVMQVRPLLGQLILLRRRSRNAPRRWRHGAVRRITATWRSG